VALKVLKKVQQTPEFLMEDPALEVSGEYGRTLEVSGGPWRSPF
jgi:hypothetical protein